MGRNPLERTIGVGSLAATEGVGGLTESAGATIIVVCGDLGSSWAGEVGSELVAGTSFGVMESDLPAPQRHLKRVDPMIPTIAVRMMFASISALVVSMRTYIFFHAIISVTRMSPPIAE